MSALDAFGGRANAIAWYGRWLTARQTTRPLPVPSTPLGLKRTQR